MQLEPVPTPRWPGRRTEAGTLLLILIVAAFFRGYRLDSIPPGFTHDEAGHGHDAVAILHGARPIYETVGYGREPLYDYVVAVLMPIFGTNYLTLRFTSVLAGLLLIVVAHFWIRRAFDVPIAIVTSASLAVSFWAISTSREALRSALLPVIFTAAMYFMWQAVKPFERQTRLPRLSPRAAKWINYLIAGLFIGLSLYTYLAARVLPFAIGWLWLYLLVFQHQLWKQHWLGLIVMVAIGLALAAPMFVYLAAHPGVEYRVTQLSGPIDQLFAGKPDEVLSNGLRALGMFSVSGDNLWLYNVPGRPILDWPLAIMFYIGVIVAIGRFRKTEYAFALFWLIVAMIPSLLTGVVASSLRSIAAQPIVYLFVGIGYVQLARWIDRVIDSHTLRSIPLVVLIVASMAYTYHDYFDQWGQARDVRVAYHVNLFEMAQFLDQATTARSDIAISSIYPNRFHDPYSMAMMLRRKDLALRWFTGSFVDATGAPHAALVFPQPLPAACGVTDDTAQCTSGVTHTTNVFTRSMPTAVTVGGDLAMAPASQPSHGSIDVLIPSIAPIDPLFADIFSRHAQPIDSIELRADDFNPRFDVYQFDATAALSDALRSSIAATGTLDFDHVLNLIGWEIRTPAVRPGATVEVITYWRIVAGTDQELVLFTHVLSGNPARPVLAQQDSLDVPSYYWFAGDAFAQVHRFTVPADARPGTYPLEIGAYNRADNQRLSLFNQNGNVIGDHFIIGSLNVAP